MEGREGGRGDREGWGRSWDSELEVVSLTVLVGKDQLKKGDELVWGNFPHHHTSLLHEVCIMMVPGGGGSTFCNAQL